MPWFHSLPLPSSPATTYGRREFLGSDAASRRVGAIVVDRSLDGLTELAEDGVRRRLGRERWARAFAAGATTSIDTLLQEIEVARQQVLIPTGPR